jgi:hypothetical protein
MGPKIFHKKMGDYLEKRKSPFCSIEHRNIFARFYCNVIVTFGIKLRLLGKKIRYLFTQSDVGELEIDAHEVRVVAAGMSPAMRGWHDFKKKFVRNMKSFGKKKEKPRVQPEDVNPDIIADTIKNDKI